jgi:hypothetical protein
MFEAFALLLIPRLCDLIISEPAVCTHTTAGSGTDRWKGATNA